MSEEVIVTPAVPARPARPVRRTETHAIPTVEATGARRFAHVVMAAAGWALFLYWWWLVAQRTSRLQVEWSALFLGVSLLAIVTTTAFWVLHNRALARRKGARTQLPPEALEVVEDALGQPLAFDGGPEAMRAAGFVRIVVEDAGKRYKSGRV